MFTRRIVLTGASEGIGGAVCRIFAQNLHDSGEKLGIVITVSGNKPKPNLLISDLQKLGAEVLLIEGDLADPAACANIVETSLSFLGGLDVLVANAGAVNPGPLAGLAMENWQRLFDINARSTFLLAQGFYAALKASRGNIVAIGSTSGLQPHTGHGAYSAAKAALTMLVRQLAQEWAVDGIRVNMIAPGLVETPLTQSVYDNLAVRRAREEIVPLGRIGQPKDIAEAVCFLASDKASYITGQVLVVDGGILDATLLRIPGLPRSNS
jgi:NAD(P)-dependent dehydrogenase (short-subunit alcohol dehydrogenase family)